MSYTGLLHKDYNSQDRIVSSLIPSNSLRCLLSLCTNTETCSFTRRYDCHTVISSSISVQNVPRVHTALTAHTPAAIAMQTLAVAMTTEYVNRTAKMAFSELSVKVRIF